MIDNETILIICSFIMGGLYYVICKLQYKNTELKNTIKQLKNE